MLRNNFILKYIKNKYIIDLGILGEDKSKNFSDFHKFLMKYAKSILGVDIHKERIEKLKSEGYNVICDNVLELKKVKEKYDVVVAGELIEHVENIQVFLDNLKKISSKNGIIIITTPNILSLRFMIRHIFLGKENPYWKDRNAEIKFGHVIGFTKILLINLFLRNNFKIINSSYIIKNEYSGFKGNLEKVISRLIPRFSPQICFILKKNE